MAWYVDSVRTFVDESKEEGGQIIPRLQPLGGSTILQIFGYESIIRNIGGLIVGDTDKNALLAKRTDGNTHTLTGPEGSLGSFYVKNVTISRIHSICQTIRPDLDIDAPVYQFEIQFF